jgi:stage III sporulation protein AA
MFYGLISGRLEGLLGDYDETLITEIRLRKGNPLVIFQGTKKIYPVSDGGRYIVTEKDIETVLGFATDFSVYAVQDQLNRGYLVKNGVRIGVSGFGVVEQGKIVTIKDINALVLRIPHQIKGCADQLMAQICHEDSVKSTLIISPPGAGKTTLLRDMARLASTKVNTMIIDERCEIAGLNCCLDVGESEVMSGIDKKIAYEFAIRSMSPTLIVTDEIFSRADVESVVDVMRCGVKIFASIHGNDLDAAKKSPVFQGLLPAFEAFVTLAPIGKVVSVEYK